MKGAKIAIGAALCAIAVPAHAGWEYAEWGMSPEEVAAASSGSVEVSAYDPESVLYGNPQRAIGSGKYMGAPVDVRFYFDPKVNALRNIDLVPERSDCARVRDNMIDTFGAIDPSDEVITLDDGTPLDQTVWEWTDPENGDQVEFLQVTTKSVLLLCKVLVVSPDTRR